MAQDQILVVDQGDSALIGVALSTGDRTTLSSDGVGAGPSLAAPIDVVMDYDLGQAFVISGAGDRIVTVDLATGDRQELSSCVTDPQEIRLHDHQAFVTGVDGSYQVDLSDGTCSPLSTVDLGLGPLALGQDGLVYEKTLNSLFVMSTSLNALLMIDVATGDRVIVSK